MQNNEIEINLKNLKQLSKSIDLEKYDYKMFINNLKEGINIKYTILCLIEVLRIDPKILSSGERTTLFTHLLKFLSEEEINLESLFNFKILNLFDLKKFSSKIIGLIKTVYPNNKIYLQKILTSLLEASEDPEKLIKSVLLQIIYDSSYNLVFYNAKRLDINQLIQIEMEKLGDKTYIDVFANLNDHLINSIREIKTSRSISNADKLRYITSAIEKGFINEVLPYYYNDKDKHVRQLLAKNSFANNKSIIMRFLNDNDPIVRKNMINNLDVEEVIHNDLDIKDRLLDVDQAVRSSAYALYNKCYEYIKNNIKTNLINCTENKENDNLELEPKKFKGKVGEEGLKEVSFFVKLTLTLFKGLFTSFNSEYKDVLNKYSFTFDFYFKYFDEPGVEIYLKTNKFEEVEYKNLTIEGKRFFFLVCKPEMNNNEIENLIKEDLLAAMYYLKGKEIKPWVNEILFACRENTLKLPVLITILERLEPYKHIVTPFKIENDIDFVIHSFISNKEITEFKENSFGSIFYKFKNQIVDKFLIDNFNNAEVYELLIASQNMKLLSKCCEKLLEESEVFLNIHWERMKLKERINNVSILDWTKQSIHNVYLYFLLTGNVEITYPDFFINIIHFISKSTINKPKISKLFKTYLSNVGKEVFYEFATICYNLRTKSMYSQDEQEYNKVQERDEILYFIVNLILNYNVYKVLEKEYNFNVFYDVIEENVQLVLSKIK